MPRSRLILLLAAMAAISPLAIDLYLPAIPLIAKDFMVGADRISVTISLYMLGLAGGQLIGGTLSDRLGRRPVMLCGMLLFALCSGLISLSGSWQSLWLLRVIQALGGGMVQVGIPAIIRDHSEGAESARMLSAIALIMISAPAVAPAIGSLILWLASWRWIFLLLCLYALIMSLLTWFRLPAAGASSAKGSIPLKAGPEPEEAVRAERAETEPQHHWLRQYWQILTNRRAVGYMLAQACSFSVMLTFVTNSSYIYLDHFGLSNQLFSLLFAGNILVMAVMNRINVRWLRRHQPERLAWRGVRMQALSVCGLLLVTLLSDNLWLTVPFILLSIGSQGAIGANTNASALRHYPHNSGAASATLGMLQFTLGAGISACSTWLQGGDIWPIALVMLGCVTVSLLGLTISHQAGRQLQPDAAPG